MRWVLAAAVVALSSVCLAQVNVEPLPDRLEDAGFAFQLDRRSTVVGPHPKPVAPGPGAPSAANYLDIVGADAPRVRQFV